MIKKDKLFLTNGITIAGDSQSTVSELLVRNVPATKRQRQMLV
jgi:hypothetical protein